MMSTAERISTADVIEACGSDDSNTVLQQSAGSALAMQEGNCSSNPDQLQLVPGQGTAGETNVNIPIAIKHHEVLQLLPGLSPDAAAAVAARKLDAGKVTVGKRVGAGAFSTVYQAQLEGSSSKWVVKRLDRVGADQMQQLANEIEMLTTAGNHPNLVPFKGWYKDEQGVLCLLLGHCEGGTLASLLKSRNGGSNEGLFPEDMVMCWFVQLLLALHHLHARRILHRDLKPENVLLSRNLRVAKLADFGISKQLEAGIGLAVTCLGTPHYMSPEVITHRPYTFASDLWALGVVLYEMASRRPAYDARGLPQLVVKILRNAYTPLPLACSRPLQQLVGLLLRADPDDRPTTTDLLGMSIVRKHVQLLVGLAQGVHRTPAATAPAAGASAAASAAAGQGGSGAVEAATDAVESGSSKSSTPRSGRSSSVTTTTATAAGADTAGAAAIRPKSADASLGNPSAAAGLTPRSAAAAACEAAAATKGDVRGPLDSQCGYDDGEEVDLGGGLSVALQDMMLALRRMARAPLHVGAGGANTPSRRSRVPAPATAAAAAAAEGGSISEAAQQQGDRKARAGTGAANTSSRSRSNSLTDKSPAGAAAVAGSSADLSEDHAPSPASSGAPAPSAAAPASPASAAVYAALPTPLAAPNTKRPVVRTWDATAQWEAQQRKQAELRYQAKVIEQRMAREQARQRRKELDPAAAAKAAQQQQELEALQEAQRKRQQQQLAAAAADGHTGLSSMSSISAAQAAAVAAQDEQLQLLLEQLRVGSGSSSSRFQIDGAVTDGCCDVAGDDDVIEEVEEEEGLDWDQSRSNDDINQDEDYTQALALAAGDADDSSGCLEAAAVDGGEQAQVAAAGKRAWKLVVASLEGSALAAMLPKCKDTAAAAAAEAEDAATSDLPQLIQSSTSPTASPRSQRRSSSNAQQQQQQQQLDDQGVFGHLEQELEKALAVSNEAAAQEVISSIYRMSLSMTGTARCHQRSQRPSDTSGTWGDTGAGQAGPAVMQPVGLWGKRVRPRSAADVARDEKAGAAFAMVVNQMFGNVFPESPESGRENATSGSSSSADLNRTITGRPKSVPADALRRRSKAADELTSTAAATLPAAVYDHHHQQQHLTSGSILDGPGSNTSSRRSSRSSSALLQQPSQPKLAYIGGLTTSRPVTTAAAAPEQLHSSSFRSNSKGALIPVWQPGRSAAAAGGGSSRVVLGGSESAQQAASATPRVDDALRILRAQDASRKGGSSSSIHHSSANLNSSSSTPANAATAGARSGLVASNSRKQLTDASKHTVTGRISSNDSSSTAPSKAGRSSSHSSNSSGPRAGSNSGSSKPTSAPAAGVSSKSSKASTGRPSSSSGEAGRASGAAPGGGSARCSSNSSRLTRLPSLSRAASRKSISKE